MKKKYKKGFTLVELLIFMGLLSIILFVLTDMLASSLEAGSQVYTFSHVQQDGRYILAKLIYDINQASAINTPARGSQSNVLQIVINGNTQTYLINSANLRLTNNGGDYLLNSYDTEISNLNFNHIGNVGGKGTIQISFTVTSKTITNVGKEIKSFQTTVGLR